MNIELWEEEQMNRKITVIHTDSFEAILLNSIPDLKKKGNVFWSNQSIGDCVTDLIYQGLINKNLGISQDTDWVNIIIQKNKMDFIYHFPSELIKLLFDNNQNNKTKYHIEFKEKNIMDENRYHVTCPSFDEVDCDYSIGRSSLRSYCLPVDEKIINVLDNPAINVVFKNLSDYGTDRNFGQMLASGIPINHENYPDEDDIIRRCSKKLGIRRPYAIISNQIPGINAMTIGSDEEPYIVLSSLLVELLNKDQLEFVIGHECGHIAMGHVVYHSAVATAGSLSKLIPFVGPTIYKYVSIPLKAWERKSEITADRAGLICCQNLEVAQRTLLQLESAFQNADNIDIDAYIANSKRYLKKGTIRKLGEYSANHPLNAKRMEALRVFANSQCYLNLTNQPITENALSNASLEYATNEILKVI